MSERKASIHNQGGRVPLGRDDQQWILDYVIQTTGKPVHFQGDRRGPYPRSIHAHSMISKHLGLAAGSMEEFASSELAVGHSEVALQVFYEAASVYIQAQHAIFELNAEKRFLYDGVSRCYAKVIELSPYPMERVVLDFEGGIVTGILHINPFVSGPAPLIFYIPGCDAAKEAYPNPRYNYAHMRGAHMFSFDGPGQAEPNMSGLRLTASNYERASSLMLDRLLDRPEIDPDGVVVYGNSFGSLWALRFAAMDDRVRAVAAPQSSIAPRYIHMDLEAPRWKQLFAFVTGAESETELDEIMSAMSMEGYMERIRCPVLMTVGEYDPRAPLDEVIPLFRQLGGPSVLWVMADQHHNVDLAGVSGPEWSTPKDAIMADWLMDRLAGRAISHTGQIVLVDGGLGPNSRSVGVLPG